MKVALAAFFGAFLGMLILGGWGDVRERQTYQQLIAAKDSLAHEVTICRNQTNQLGGRLSLLAERLPRRRR